MRAPSVLIFDVDNTLYDFVDFFGPSFRSMVHALAKTERLPESEIIRSARAVYQRAGTLEHQFLIQSMDIFASRAPIERERLIRLARVAFSKTRNARLKLYDGMGEVMASARANGFKCVCVTNAPYYHVEGRLRDLNVLALIDGLVAWEGSGVDESRPDYVRKYSGRKEQLQKRLQLFCTAESTNLKPATYPFKVIANRFGSRFHYFAIGDSIAKDLQPARAAGMNTIWARYGTKVDPRNLATLLEVTPWTAQEIALSKEKLAEPDFVADSPRDIARILNIPMQAELFG
jgi:FMN phosphatase YigB (HAD superfamily)